MQKPQFPSSAETVASGQENIKFIIIVAIIIHCWTAIKMDSAL